MSLSSFQQQGFQQQGYQHAGLVKLCLVIDSLWRLDTAVRT